MPFEPKEYQLDEMDEFFNSGGQVQVKDKTPQGGLFVPEPKTYRPEEMMDEFNIMGPEQEKRDRAKQKEIEATRQSLPEQAGKALGRAGEDIRSTIWSGLEALDKLPYTVAMAVKKRTDPEEYKTLMENEEITKELFAKRVQGAVGEILAEPIVPNEELQKVAQEQLEISQRYKDIAFGKSEIGKQGIFEGYKDVDWWTENVSDVGIQLAQIIGLNAVAPGLGLGALGTQVASAQYQETKKRLAEKGWDVNDAELMSMGQGAVMGLIEAALEYVPAKIISRMPGGKAEFFEMAARKYLGDIAGRPAAAMTAEALEELGAEFAGDTMQYLAENDPEAYLNWKERYTQAAALGAAGGKIASVPGTAADVATAPKRKSAQIESQVAEAVRTIEGRNRLKELGQKEKPSRKDFKEAGILAPMSDKRRAELAKEFKGLVEEIDQTVISEAPGVAKSAVVEDAEVEPTEPPPEIAPEYADVAEQQLAPRQEVPPLRSQQLADPKERVKVQKDIAKATGVSEQAAADTAAIAQSALTSDQLERISIVKGGEPGPDALFQIAEAANEMAEDPNFKRESDEKRFFNRFAQQVKKVRTRMGRKKPTSLKPAARSALKDYQKALKEKKGKAKIPDLGSGKEFDANMSTAAPKVAQTALEDSIDFLTENEFRDYYGKDVEREREALAAKHPEIKLEGGQRPGDRVPANYNFWLNRALGALASAETELSKNTSESEAAYSGYKQTGRVPVQIVKDANGKDRPIYQLPKPDDAKHQAVMPEEVDAIVAGAQEMDPDVPQEVIDIAMGRKPIPEGLTRLDSGNKGRPIKNTKDYIYGYLAPKYGSKHTSKFNTSSKALVAKLFLEFKEGGEEAFRGRIRTAFEISGGSSLYNKARNYQAINRLLDKFDGDVVKLIDYLNERVPMKEVDAARQEVGFGKTSAQSRKAIIDNVWVAENQQENIPRAFMFGPKVGAYLLNRMADYNPLNAEYNTMDVWESRYWRTYHPELNDNNVGIADGIFRQVYMRDAREFAKAYKEKTGEHLPASAGQASRWFEMKKAAKKAGYDRAGTQGTIADFTQAVIEKRLGETIGDTNDMGTEFAAAFGVPRDSIDTMSGQKQVADTEQAKAPKRKITAKRKKALETDQAMERMERKAKESKQNERIKEEVKQGEITKTEEVTTPTDKVTEAIVTPGEVATTLFQTDKGVVRGSMEATPGGDIIIRAFEGADVDTVLEELAHGIRQLVWAAHAEGGEAKSGLSNKDVKVIERWAGQKKKGTDKWSRRMEERFAKGVRQLIAQNKAPAPHLKGPFQRLSGMLSKIYEKVKRGVLGVRMRPDVEEALGKLLTRRERVQKGKVTAKIVAPKKGEVSAKKAIGKVPAPYETSKATVQPATGREEALSAIEAQGNQAATQQDTKKAGVPPEYVREGGKVVLYRYSHQDRGETYEVDPEKARPRPYSRRDYDRSPTPRTFFYLNTSEKELITGQELYATEYDASDIYNLIEDPEGIKARHPMAGIYDFDKIFDDVKAAGYKGVYYNPRFHVVNLFEKVETRRTPDVARKNVDKKKSQEIWSGVQKQIRADEPAGFTYNPTTGEFASSGFAVAPSKSMEMVIDLGEVKTYQVPDLITRYAGRVADLLGQENYNLGAWVDDGKLHLDVSIVVSDQAEATRIAKENDQLAIFDIAREVEIKTSEPFESLAEPGQSTLIPDFSTEQRDSGRTISKREVINNILNNIGMTFTGSFKGFRSGVQGYYRWIQNFGDPQFPGKEMNVRARDLGQVGVTIHEAAHALDDKYNITGLKPSDPSGNPLMGGLTDVQLATIRSLDYDKEAGRLQEGWAEMTRLWATFADPSPYIPASAMDAMNSILHSNPELANQLNAIKKDMMDYMGQTDVQKIAHAIAAPGTQVLDPNRTLLQRQGWAAKLTRLFERKKLDQDYDLVLAERQIENDFKEHWNGLSKSARGNVTADKAWSDVVKRAGGMPSQLKLAAPNAINESSEDAMMNGVFDIDTGEVLSKSSPEIFKDFSDSEVEEFGQYMYSKVAVERWEKAAEKGIDYVPGEVDIKTLQDFVRTVESGDRKSKYQKAAKDVTNYFNALIDAQTRVGLLSGREADAIKGSHTTYMPFYRQFSGATPGQSGRFVGVKAAARKLKRGSIMPVLDVYQAMIDKTNEAYGAMHKHRVGKSFVDIATKSGVGAPFITRIRDPIRKVLKVEEMLDELQQNDLMPPEQLEYYRDKLERGEVTKDDEIDLWKWFVYGQPRFQNEDSKFIFAYRREDGSTIRYKIDPDIHRVMTFSNSPQMSETAARVLSVVGYPTSLARKLMVHLNLPYFATVNQVRDVKTAMIKGEQDLTDQTGFGIVGPLSIAKEWNPKRALRAKETDVDKLFRRAGGTRGTRVKTASRIAPGRVSGLAGAIFKPGETAIQRKKRRRMTGRQGTDAIDAYATGMEFLEGVNDTIELAPRRATFLKTLIALSEGDQTGDWSVSKDGKITGNVPQWASSRAMYNAMEVTVNFNRRGEWASYLEPFFLFYNAAMQGNNSQLMTIQAARKDPRQLAKVAANLTIGIMAKGIALGMMASTFIDDDDEEKGNLLDRYWEVPDYYKRTQDVIIAKVMGDAHAIALPTEREWKILSDVAEEFFWKPLFIANGYDVPHRVSSNNAVKLMGEEISERIPFTGGTLPTAIQLMFGKDIFRGWKPLESEWDQRKLTEYRMTDRTAWAHPISKHGAKHIGLSPNEIDFLVRNAFGSMAPNLYQFAFGEGDKKRRVTKTPFVGRFLVDDTPRQSYSDFYDMYRQHEQLFHAWKHGMKFSDEQQEALFDNEVMLGNVASVLTTIREVDDSVMSRQEKAAYQTGLVRWATGQKALAEYPNPLQVYSDKGEGLPDPVKLAVLRMVRSASRRPRPDKESEKGREKFIKEVQAKKRFGAKMLQAVEGEK